jgi:secretion/DNA translocation related CpaE-like protein
MRAPLLITRDDHLLDDVLRLAAAAGVTLDVAHDPLAALRQWRAAPLVLVGADLAEAVGGQAPPRRSDVYLLADGEPDYRTAVALGASDVVALPAAEAWLVEAMADVGDGASRSAVTVGFLGGSGGVGATTLACAVAQLGAGERPAALIDLDPLGPGVERVVGIDVADGVRWPDLASSQGRLGSRALRDSLPQREGLAVLGWGPDLGGAVEEATAREVLASAQRGHDLVVVDLPRHLSGAAELVAARCDLVVLVGACSLPGAAAAVRALDSVSAVAAAVQLVARSTRGAVTGHQLAGALALPLLASVGFQRQLAEHVDIGLGPLHARRGPVARAAGEILEALA